MSILDGSFYIDDLTGNFYLRESGAWVLKGNLAGLINDPLGTSSQIAGQFSFLGFDQSEQFRINSLAGATNFLGALGGRTASGATLLAQSDVNANVDLNLTAQGTGAIAFGNYSGQLFAVGDPGAPITYFATLYPGTATLPARIDTPATQQFGISIGGSLGCVFKNPGAASITWPSLVSSSTAFPIITVDGAASSVQLTLQAKGTALVAIGSSSRGQSLYIGSPSNTVANRWEVIGGIAGASCTYGLSTDSETTGVGYFNCPQTTQLLKSDQWAFQNIIAKQGYSTIVATNAGTHTVAAGKSGVVYNPAGTIGSFTETLPASPIDGQECDFTTTHTITAYTLSPNTGQSVVGAPITLTPSTPIKVRYVLSITTWVTVVASLSSTTQYQQLTYTSGNWYIPPGGGLIGTVTPTVSQIIFMPFLAQQNFSISAIGAFVSTFAVSTNAQFAIYAADPTTHLPTGAALSSTASVATTSNIAVSAVLGANVPIVAGNLYYLAINVDTGTVIFSGSGQASATPLGQLVGDATLANIALNQTSLGCYTLAQTFNTWPTVTASTFVRHSAGASIGLLFKVV
jgi:hypothetical protein